LLRLVHTSDGPLVAGSYTTGSSLHYDPGWDMEEIGRVPDTPPDLEKRLEDPATFFEKPARA
jgi:hypothetical protein